MKKSILSIAFLFACITLFGQAKLVKSATKNLTKGNLPKAVEEIEGAILNDETKMIPNTWLVRARVYTAVAGNPLIKSRYENPEDIALASYAKAYELDPTPKTEMIINLEIPKLNDAFSNLGIEKFQEKDYAKATDAFEKSFEISQRLGVLDTGTLFNIALSAAYAGDVEKSKIKYELLVEYGYSQPSIYAGLADVYQKLGKNEEASAVMDKGVAKHPEDYNVYVAAATTNLLLGKNEKAEKILQDAIAKWPESKLLYYATGVAYDNIKNVKAAEAAYLKALELDPLYLDVLFNLGVVYFNEGGALKLAADNLPLSESVKYESEMAKANVYFEKAIPYFEKLIATDPSNLGALKSLKETYAHLRKMDKVKELNEKIEALENQ